jgi:hypothetical protein
VLQYAQVAPDRRAEDLRGDVPPLPGVALGDGEQVVNRAGIGTGAGDHPPEPPEIDLPTAEEGPHEPGPAEQQLVSVHSEIASVVGLRAIPREWKSVAPADAQP